MFSIGTFFRIYHIPVCHITQLGRRWRWISLFSTKKEVKIEILERAIDELKYESESSSEPSSDGDTKRLREFLENMNEFG